MIGEVKYKISYPPMKDYSDVPSNISIASIILALYTYLNQIALILAFIVLLSVIVQLIEYSQIEENNIILKFSIILKVIMMSNTI